LACAYFLEDFVALLQGLAAVEFEQLHPFKQQSLVFEVYSFGGVCSVTVGNLDAEAVDLLIEPLHRHAL
jgi:hypothetical protein